MFGFVSAPGLPPWPSKLLSEAGGKLSVFFFGTGQISLVNKSNWISYTQEQLKKVDTTKNKKKWGAFRAGLDQLREAIKELCERVKEPTINESGDGKINLKKGVDLKKPKNVSLRQQQLENQRKFNETIIKVGSKRQWKCTRCTFRTGLRYKAKAHAILCNSMLKARKKRNKKYLCLLCPKEESFSSKKEYRIHVKSKHDRGVNFICPDHKKPVKFGDRKSFLRHRKEQHVFDDLASRKYPCLDCPKAFKRKHDLKKHIGRLHLGRKIAKDIIDKIMKDIDPKDDTEGLDTKKDHTESSDVIKDHKERSDVIKEHKESSDVIKDHKESSDIIKDVVNDMINSIPFNVPKAKSSDHKNVDIGWDRSNDLYEENSHKIGGTLSQKDKERLQNIKEKNEMYRALFKEEIESKEREERQKAQMVAERKRKASLTKDSLKDQPVRKSARLNGYQVGKNKENEDHGYQDGKNKEGEDRGYQDEKNKGSEDHDYQDGKNKESEDDGYQVGKNKESEDHDYQVGKNKENKDPGERHAASKSIDGISESGSNSENNIHQTKSNETDKTIAIKLDNDVTMYIKLDTRFNNQGNNDNELNKIVINVEDDKIELNASDESTSKASRTKFACTLCYKDNFQNNHKLGQHMYRMHEAKDPPPECHRTWCSQTFPTKYERDRHTEFCFMHCTTCNKKFKREDKYKAHERMEASISKRLNFMR